MLKEIVGFMRATWLAWVLPLMILGMIVTSQASQKPEEKTDAQKLVELQDKYDLLAIKEAYRASVEANQAATLAQTDLSQKMTAYKVKHTIPLDYIFDLNNLKFVPPVKNPENPPVK